MPAFLPFCGQLGLREPQLAAHQLGDLLGQPVHQRADRLVRGRCRGVSSCPPGRARLVVVHACVRNADAGRVDYPVDPSTIDQAMPSRMSASEATRASTCARREDPAKDQRAGGDHVGAAGVHLGQRQPVGDGHRRPAGRRTRARRRRARTDWSIASASYAGRSSAAGHHRERRCRPPRPPSPRPRVDRAGVEVGVDVGDAGRDLPAVGGSEWRCRSCSRTEPDVHRVRGVRRVRRPRISSVEPPPMSIDQHRLRRRRAQVAGSPRRRPARPPRPR